MAGATNLGLPRLTARCASEIKIANNLTEFVRVRLERKDGEYLATPTGSQGSGILSSVSRADGLLIGPASVNLLRPGDQATVLLLNSGADEEVFFERRLHKN